MDRLTVEQLSHRVLRRPRQTHTHTQKKNYYSINPTTRINKREAGKKARKMHNKYLDFIFIVLLTHGTHRTSYEIRLPDEKCKRKKNSKIL